MWTRIVHIVRIVQSGLTGIIDVGYFFSMVGDIIVDIAGIEELGKRLNRQILRIINEITGGWVVFL